MTTDLRPARRRVRRPPVPTTGEPDVDPVIKVIDSDVVPEVDPYVESDPGPRQEPEHDVEADLGYAPGRVDENDDGDFTDGDMSVEDSDLGTPREVATYLGPDGPSERTIQRLVSDG